MSIVRNSALIKTFSWNFREHKALSQLIHSEGDFITIVGGNGAGNRLSLAVLVILGRRNNLVWRPSNRLRSFERAAYISRVFQDPMQGTALV